MASVTPTRKSYVTRRPIRADAPAVGSVFDTYTLAIAAFANVYSAIVPPAAANIEITDTVETPEGDYNDSHHV